MISTVDRENGLYPTDRVGAEEAYLLYKRGTWGRSDTLIGVYASAKELLADIGTSWPTQRTQRLFAAYRNGSLREIRQTTELMVPPPPPTNGAI